MKRFFQWLANLLRRKSAWDGYDYGPPSTQGDDLRKLND